MLAVAAVGGAISLMHYMRNDHPCEFRNTSEPSTLSQIEIPQRVRRAETVLRHRTSRVILVLEASIDENNHQVSGQPPHRLELACRLSFAQQRHSECSTCGFCGPLTRRQVARWALLTWWID